MVLIDAHSHLQNYSTVDIETMLSSSTVNSGSKFLVNAISKADWSKVISLSKQYESIIIPFLGLHPWFAADITRQDYTQLERMVSLYRCGIGEIGLDFTKKIKQHSKQVDCFLQQLALAQKYKRPVAIHSVKAHNDLVRILRNCRETPSFMVHSFCGSKQMAGDIIDLNGYISLSFSILKMNSLKLKELAAYLPLQNILLETDAPDQALPLPAIQKYYPYPDNISSNSPELLQLLYKIFAEIKGIDQNELADNINRNCTEYMKDIR